MHWTSIFLCLLMHFVMRMFMFHTINVVVNFCMSDGEENLLILSSDQPLQNVPSYRLHDVREYGNGTSIYRDDYLASMQFLFYFSVSSYRCLSTLYNRVVYD